MKPKLFLIAAACFLTTIVIAQQKGYYRYPSINKKTVVFTAEGDLWKYDILARTTHRKQLYTIKFRKLIIFNTGLTPIQMLATFFRDPANSNQ